MNISDKRINLLTVIFSGLRHRWLVYFRPRYTIDSLLRRKGQCKSCGRCDTLNTPWCRYFKDNKCQVYERQPFFCKIFPIDPKDKELSGVGEACGYWWENESCKK